MFTLSEQTGPGGGSVYVYSGGCWWAVSGGGYLSIAPMNQASFTDTSIYIRATDINGNSYYRYSSPIF
jgi:hypothetical protein